MRCVFLDNDVDFLVSQSQSEWSTPFTALFFECVFDDRHITASKQLTVEIESCTVVPSTAFDSYIVCSSQREKATLAASANLAFTPGVTLQSRSLFRILVFVVML
jgi:hypothetical protein